MHLPLTMSIMMMMSMVSSGKCKIRRRAQPERRFFKHYSINIASVLGMMPIGKQCNPRPALAQCGCSCNLVDYHTQQSVCAIAITITALLTQCICRCNYAA